MATTLFMLNPTDASISGYDSHTMGTSRGAGLNAYSGDTSASGNHIELITVGSATPKCWIYQVNAVTISGTISFNWWGNELTMADNVGFACRIARYDSSGTFVSDIVANANANHADGVELSLSAALRTWSATPTSTSLSSGDYIVAIPHGDAVGTMGAGQYTFDVGAASAGVDGDSFITFTESVTEFTQEDRPPRFTPYPQLLAHAEAYRPRRKFTFLDGLWRPDRRLVPA